jgi:hypothetical protein
VCEFTDGGDIDTRPAGGYDAPAPGFDAQKGSPSRLVSHFSAAWRCPPYGSSRTGGPTCSRGCSRPSEPAEILRIVTVPVRILGDGLPVGVSADRLFLISFRRNFRLEMLGSSIGSLPRAWRQRSGSSPSTQRLRKPTRSAASHATPDSRFRPRACRAPRLPERDSARHSGNARLTRVPSRGFTGLRRPRPGSPSRRVAA